MSEAQLAPSEVLRQAAPGFFINIVVVLVYYLVHPGFALLLASVLAWVLLANLWRAYRAAWRAPHWGRSLLLACAISAGFLVVLRVLSWLLGPYGFVGLLGIVLVTSAFLIWRNWRVYVWGVRESYRAIRGEYPEETRKRRGLQ